MSFTFNETTRRVKAGEIKALEVLYKDTALALFTEENGGADLHARAEAYVKTYGYLAEWTRQNILQKRIVNWDESMRVSIN